MLHNIAAASRVQACNVRGGLQFAARTLSSLHLPHNSLINNNINTNTVISLNQNNNNNNNNNYNVNVAAARNVQTLTRRGRGGRVSISGMTATVFGATGFLGRYIVNELGKTGTQIIIAHRPGEMHIRHLRPMCDVGEIQFVEVDFSDPQAIKDTMEFSDIAINCVGADAATRNFSLHSANADIPARIAQCASDAGVDRFVHISSLGADKNSPSEFLRAKASGEEGVSKAFKNATIIRPAQMYGAEDRYLNRIAFSLNWRFLPLTHLDVERLPVYVHDVALATVSAATFDDKAPGSTYELVGPDAFTIDNLYAKMMDLTHHNPAIQEIPEGVAKTLVSLSNKLFVLKDRKLDLDQLQRYGLSEPSQKTNKPGILYMYYNYKLFQSSL